MKLHPGIRALVAFLFAFGIGEVLDWVFFGLSKLSPPVAAVYENLTTAALTVVLLYLLGVFDPNLVKCPLPHAEDCPFMQKKGCDSCPKPR